MLDSLSMTPIWKKVVGHMASDLYYIKIYKNELINYLL
jgi:hypothetical protein